MKRLLILAGVSILTLPAGGRALDGEVTIYGTVLPFVDSSQISSPTATAPAGGATQVGGTAYTGAKVSPRLRLTTGTTNLGFKGGLDLLGEDLQAFFQVECTLSIDAADSPNALAGRNTGAGLKGKFGRLLLGNWDTPYKIPIVPVAPLRGLNPFDNAIVGAPGFGVPATTTASGRVNKVADAAFNRRQGNSIQYWSPEVYGFTGRVGVSLNEGKTADTPTAPSISPTLYSLMLGYANGPVTVRYAYERHQDYFGLSQLGGSPGDTVTNRHSTDEGHLVTAQVALPFGTKVSAMVERLSYANQEDTPGLVKSWARLAGAALVQQRIGDHQLWVSYGMADKGTCKVAETGSCTTKGLGASQLGLGYSYSIGKSFDVFASYYQLVNEKSASYGVVGGPGTVAPGGDTRGFGVGFLYTFAATAAVGQPKGL